MKKGNVLLIVLIVALLIGLGGYMLYQNATKPESSRYDEDAMMQEDSMTGDEDAMMNDEDAMDGEDNMMDDETSMMIDGGYVAYEDGVLEDYAGTRRVLFFYANWCPTCRPADNDFTKNVGSFPDDLTLIRVNYNDSDTDAAEKALAEKYGVTYQHTFVQIDADGTEVAKWNGGQTADLLKNVN